MSGIFGALGSNLGERERNLARALRELEGLGVRVKDESSLYLTEPVGGPKQDWIVNPAARVETALSPEALLAAGLQVEETMGRVRGARDGPRLPPA